jgi:hypothetical protein
MKYMMMMHFGRDCAGASIDTWPPQDLKAHIDFMIALNKRLSAAGELVAAEGLAWPDQAKLVRAGKDGRPITDGPFPETKEFLAGFWIVDVDSEARAVAIAAEASAAPGFGGVRMSIPIEIRQVMGAPDVGA